MFDNEISLAVFFDTNAAVSISQRTFCYNGTWQLMGTVNTAGVQPMKFYEEAINWSYDSTYPNYTYLEVGTSDGNREWNMVGELTTENNTGNWSSAIQTYLGTCTADGNGNCQVPIQFGSKTRGKINISKIQVLYNFNPNPIELNVTLIKDFLSSSNEFVDIPLKFIPETNCTLTVNDLRFDHAGGNDTLAVLAHTVGYASSVSHDITYFYSAWNYSMPKYIDYLEFLPNTATSRNVTPYGQTYGKPILNFTSYQYGGQLANISIYINDTFECVNISIGINTTKPVNRIENDTWTNLNTSMDYLDSFGNWMYADFNCNYSQWNLFNPTYYFRACCTDCICSEEVI